MQAFRPLAGKPAAWQFGVMQWWLRPVPILLLVMALYLKFLGFNYESWVPRRYLPGEDYWWGLALLAILAVGCALGSTLGRRPMAARMALSVGPGRPVDVPPMLMALLLGLTLLAYAIWFGPLFANPGVIVERFTGARSTLRDATSTLPGVTTLTQCGIAYVILFAIKHYVGMRRPQRWERWGLALVLGLATMRSVLWAERLALIEVVVPLVVTALAFHRFRGKGTATLLSLLPLVGSILLYLVFTATEYFRAWPYYQDRYSSVWMFSLDRLTAYYAIATNSGIGLLQESRNWPHFSGQYVFEWLYDMPGIGPLLTEAVGNYRRDYEHFLLYVGRAEFNNPTGIFVIVHDVGYLGSALYFLLVGLLIGGCWSSFRQQHLAGLLAYPMCFMFMLELLRFNYFASTRFIPVLAALLLAHAWISSHRRPALRLARPAPPLSRQEV